MSDASYRMPYQVLEQNTANATWNGTGMTLLVGQSALMTQTPNGTLVFGYFNLSPQNSAGELILTTGGNLYRDLQVPALMTVPGIVMNNFAANNLNVTNVSGNSNTPIYISAYGPGVPGQFPGRLVIGTPLQLGTTQSAQGTTNPQAMQLVMTVSNPQLGVFAVVGGPPDGTGNNGYVFAVNASANTGPGTGVTPPPGYTATVTGNTYTYSFNWGGATLYVVNMSASTVVGQVLLRAL
jgi:hypothetical protein